MLMLIAGFGNYVTSISSRAFVANRWVMMIRVSKWATPTFCIGDDYSFNATAPGSCPETARVVDHSGCGGARIAGVLSTARPGQTRRANQMWWGGAAAAADSLEVASDCERCGAL